MKRRQVLCSVFALSVLPSCKTLGGLLPVIGEIIDGITKAKEVLDRIDSGVQLYFSASPNLCAQEKYARAKGVADNALTAVLKAAEGVENASNEDVDAAWADFQEAYTALLVALSDIGFQVRFKDGYFRTHQGHLPLIIEVERPEALKVRGD